MEEEDPKKLFSFILRPSAIPCAGVGVFAISPIPKGSTFSLCPEGYTYHDRDAQSIPETLRQYCIFTEHDRYLCPQDFTLMPLDSYVNHSSKPNASSDPEIIGLYTALRDILPEEEIVIDYNAFNEPEDLKEYFYHTTTTVENT